MGQYLSTDIGLGWVLGSDAGAWESEELAQYFELTEEENDIEDIIWSIQGDPTTKEYWEKRKQIQNESPLSISFGGPTEYYNVYVLMHKESVTQLLESVGPLPDISKYAHLKQRWTDELKAEVKRLNIPLDTEPEFLVVSSYG